MQHPSQESYRPYTYAAQRRDPGYWGNGQGASSNNVGYRERQISVAVGGLLILHALLSRSRYSPWTGALGAALIWHGQSDRSPFYSLLNVNTAQQDGDWPRHDSWRSENIAVQRREPMPDERALSGNAIEIKRAVTIDKPAEELYNYWRKLENLPNFMDHLERVEQTDETHSHWKAKIAGGLPVEWDAEIVEDTPGERIAWRTLPDSRVEQVGVVEFKPATGERGTVVYVDLKYNPPGGIIGETFSNLLNGVTAQQVKDDISRFKSLMEAGEIPTVEGQPSGRR